MKWLSAVLVALITFSTFQALGISDLNEGKVKILFYFSPGDYIWTEEDYHSNMNAFDYFTSASQRLGWNISYENSSYGVFITGLRGFVTPSDYSSFWAFLLWNSSSKMWEYAPVGVSNYYPIKSDIISLYFTQNFGDIPAPTPSHPYPAQYAGDILNPIWKNDIDKLSQEYAKSIGDGPIDVPPLSVDGNILLFSGGIFNYSSSERTSPSRITLLRSSGEVLWKGDVGGRGYELSTPLIEHEKIYVGSTDGNLYIFSYSNGSLINSTHIDNSSSGITSEIVPFKGGVIVPGGDGNLTYLDSKGSILSKLLLNDTFYYAHPALSSDKMVLAGRGGRIYIINLSKGSVEKYFKATGMIKAPVVHFNRAFYIVSTLGENTTILKLTNQLQRVATIPFEGRAGFNILKINQKYYFAVSNSKGVYLMNVEKTVGINLPSNGPVDSTAISDSKHVIFLSNIGIGGNASTIYSYWPEGYLAFKTTPEPEGWIFPSPLVSEGYLYLANDNGFLLKFKINKIPYSAPFVEFYPLKKNLTYSKTPVEFSVLVSPHSAGYYNVTWYLNGKEVRLKLETFNLSENLFTPNVMEYNVTVKIDFHNVTMIHTWIVQKTKNHPPESGKNLQITTLSIIVLLSLSAVFILLILLLRKKKKGGAEEE